MKVPNVVMVFSNDEPDTTELAKDRWKVFEIDNDQLEEMPVNNCSYVAYKNKEFKFDSDSDCGGDDY